MRGITKREGEAWVTGDEMRKRCWRKREKRQRRSGPSVNSRGKRINGGGGQL